MNDFKQKATRTLLFLLKRIQSLQTVHSQKTATFGGKESDILQKEILLTGKETLVLHSLKTKLLRAKKWLTRMHALQHLQSSVLVSHQNGNHQKAFLFLQSSSVDAALQQFRLFIRHAVGITVYSSVLS